MFNSLIKFEWKSMIRYLWIVWAALLAASLLLGTTGRIYRNYFSSGDSIGNSDTGMYMILKVLPQWVFWLIFVAEIVFTCILVIARFYKGLLDTEGYLMHTLPVKTWQLIDAKGLVAGISVILSGIVALLSLGIMSGISGGSWVSQLVIDAWMPDDITGNSVVLVIEWSILGIIYCLCQIYKSYAAMSIGQLAGRHRILISAAVYVGFNIALSILSTVLMVTMSLSNCGFEMLMDTSDGFRQCQILFVVILIPLAIELVVFHIIAEQMLSKRLNLL